MLIVGIAGGTGSGKTKINFDHPDSVAFGLLILLYREGLTTR